MSRKGDTSRAPTMDTSKPAAKEEQTLRWIKTARILPTGQRTSTITAPKGSRLLGVVMAKPPSGDPEVVFLSPVRPVDAPAETWIVTTLRTASTISSEPGEFVGSWQHQGYRVYCFVRGPFDDRERQEEGRATERPA